MIEDVKPASVRHQFFNWIGVHGIRVAAKANRFHVCALWKRVREKMRNETFSRADGQQW